MNIFRTKKEIYDYYDRKSIKAVGFVPTMGALHEGHASLVTRAKNECPVVAVSIFVNPTQFNDPADLEKYPRTEEDDIKMLDTILGPDDFIFIPTVNEIYPEPDTRVFGFGDLEKVMEGLHRPGHFNGVAQVVSILFSIINPAVAFFGQKDFQQVAIIKSMVSQYFQEIEIRSCPIIREKDGLAMSSRNRRLMPEHRSKAGIIFRTLNLASKMSLRNDPETIRAFVISTIEKETGFRIEYFEIVDSETLKPLYSAREIMPRHRYFGCIALFAGAIRLIDNIEMQL